MKQSLRVSETVSMGNSISPKEELALKDWQLMLKSRGLELSDSNAIKTWDTIVTLGPWVPSSNLFSCTTWAQVEKLAIEREKHFGIAPPLEFYPTITALKIVFHLDTILPHLRSLQRERGQCRTWER